MRFLFLHGVGGSASIVESPFGPFLNAVDPSYEIVFVDGPTPSTRGPGLGSGVKGPFWSHTTGYSPGEMAVALDHLDKTIKEIGPFDAAIGYSQGAATIISYIFDQQTRHGRRPFKFAMLFSSVCAFSPDPEFARGVLEEVCTRGGNFKAILEEENCTSNLSSGARAFAEAFANVIIPLKQGGALFPDIDMDIYKESKSIEKAPRLLLPEIMSGKIEIPTIHVYGRYDADFMRAMAFIARGTCEGKLIKSVEHSGGHEAPKKDSDVRAAVRAMDWAIQQAQRLGYFS